jgi:hypothetical protein
MTYASGGLISATDFNGLAQTTVGANVAFVLGSGSGDSGYGQTTTAIAAVATSNTVTAAQWNGLVYLINRGLAHQSGAGAQLATGSNIGITAGAIIQYFANVSTSATTIYTNRQLLTAQGTTQTGGNFAQASGAIASNAAWTVSWNRTVTFASADQARYFFNAGGNINISISSVTITTASTRSTDIQSLMATWIKGVSTFRNVGNGGRTGAGATLNTNATTIGYRQLTTAPQTLVQVTSTTAAYTTDVGNIRVFTNAVNSGGKGDFGSVITFMFGISAPAHSAFNAALNVTINHQIDILPPETTYLNNSWGTITVA